MRRRKAMYSSRSPMSGRVSVGKWTASCSISSVRDSELPCAPRPARISRHSSQAVKDNRQPVMIVRSSKNGGSDVRACPTQPGTGALCCHTLTSCDDITRH